MDQTHLLPWVGWQRSYVPIHVVDAQVASDGSLVIVGHEGRFRGRVWLAH